VDSKHDIIVNNLSVKYHQFEAVKDVNFKVNNKDFIAIVGPNGSGKTTLIKALLGLKSIASGTVLKSKLLSVGYLPQSTALQDRQFPATVEEVILTGRLANKKFPKRYNQEDYAEMIKVLEYLDIVALRKKRIGLLSGGQQQRVLLARALVNKPDVLIMDEPTSALDQSIRDQFYKLIKMLNEEIDMTILLVTHDIASAGDYVNRVIYMDQTILFDGPFREFCEQKELSPFIHTHALRRAKRSEG